MNFTARLVLVGLFMSSSVHQAFAQKPEVDSLQLNRANPSYFRTHLCNFFLDDRVVTVMLDDQSVLSGKIEQVGSEQFSLVSESGPLAIRFDRVRRLSAPAQKHSPAREARERAQRFHLDKPKYLVRVKLRQNGGPRPQASAGHSSGRDPRESRELIGRVIRADELTFVLREKDSGDESELDYRDVQRISPTFEESVLDGFNTTLLVVAVILLWPLAILSGMDC